MKLSITMGGNPIELIGNPIEVGTKAPDFTAVKADMSPFNLSELDGHIKIISVVPSLDTRVCEFQTIRFNEEATKHPNAKMITISVDLPFAQKRFCSSHSIEDAIVISDYQRLDFGEKYGFAIKDLRLLTRGIVILDENNQVRYVEYVPELSSHPDYDKALAFLETL